MHNSIGRFYETQSYGPRNQDLRLPANSTSREWYRPNPPLPQIKWGPRNNVNIQQCALLLAMQFVAKNREMFLENYYLKNKRAIEMGKSEAPYAWLIPAGQRRRGEAAKLVNLLRLQGVEVHTANAAFTAGKAPGGGRRLRRPHGPAVQHLRGDCPRHAVLRARQPEPVRRHRLVDPAAAQREGVRRSKTRRSSTSR